MVPKSSAPMATQESVNDSEAYVLADNLESSCHLSNYFNKSNVPLPVFSRAGTFDSVGNFEASSNIGPLDVSWCSDAGDSDDSDSESDDSDSDDEGVGHGLHYSAGLACILLQRIEVSNDCKEPITKCKVNMRPADGARQNGAKCVRFPPAGQEVSRCFDCPWMQKSDDYHALFYTSREIQQMKDAEIAERDELKIIA